MEQMTEPVGDISPETWAELTPEEQEEARSVAQAVDAFLADARALRYVESESNKGALLNFLEEHSLPITHSSLILAFESLGDELELLPRAEPVATPAPRIAPAPVSAKNFRNGQPIDEFGRIIRQ